jgi:hypothetical protein
MDPGPAVTVTAQEQKQLWKNTFDRFPRANTTF